MAQTTNLIPIRTVDTPDDPPNNHRTESDQKNNSTVDSGQVVYRARETWSNKFEFIFSSMAFSVGLGNVWRFPYLCFKNGGGAFFVPYFICLLGAGIPLYFLEVAIGQYWQNGSLTVWEMICPLMKGIGYASTITCFILNIYYIVILSWAFLYLYYSFNFTLPWSTCDNPWNTPACTNETVTNIGSNSNSSGIELKDSVVEFWERKILQISDGIEEVGGLQIELAITLAIAWVISFFCIWRGIKSTGKAAYVTAIFPYIMLVILFIRGVTLPGAIDGIIFYIKPDFSKVATVQVWIDAGTQIFFSYAIALGTMTALGSYNNFNNNFYHQMVFVAFMNSGTSIFAGFAIFSVLGYMAHQKGAPIETVAEKGPGLAFIAYPKGVSTMPGAPIWAILFFIMILLLGMGSQFISVEGFVTAVVDMFPKYLRVNKRREYFIAGVCFVSYLLGLSMVTRGGMYVFQLFDFYGASGVCLLTIAFCESVTLAWFYGASRFGENTREMLGFRIPLWFDICWKYLTPIITMFVLLLSIFLLEPIKYNGTYVYPGWAIAFGWSLALSSILSIPSYWIYAYANAPGKTFKAKWKYLTGNSPSPHYQSDISPEEKQAITNPEVSNP
ncbi:sodium- and chloride-dependent creatine transporter 1-like [Brevipalpus obovatus]|uniref:sodium- and chloride-dependent creatine transporter 1-like n=1 Tax=Brevipalpus obovatus TaxID=246614 RepID=UPI003D9DB731